MKKILFFIIIFLMFYININALEDEWTDEILIDKKIIETELRYKFYKLNLAETKYELYDFDYKEEYDLNDYLYTDYSEWSKEYPINKFYREIETKKEEIDSTKFNSINIFNFQGTNTFTIKGIIVTIKSLDKIINYELLGNEYVESENLKKITNSISNPGINFNSNSILYLNFPQYYDADDIRISVHYNSNSNLNKSFDVIFNNDDYKISYKTINIEKHYLPVSLLDIYSNEFNIYEDLYEIMYRYKDKLFNRKIYVKEYIDGYFKERENYNKDLNTVKVFYKYKEKDKCICNEPEVIKEEILTEKIKTEYITEYVTKYKDNYITMLSECECDKCINYINNKKPKINYNYEIIIGSIFLIIGFTLYLLIIFLKKLVNICRTK